MSHQQLEHSIQHRSVKEVTPESEELFRIMADTAPGMIWIAGCDTLCYYFNSAWLEFTGRTLEQEMGNGWASSVHPEDVQRCLAVYLATFEVREKFQIEYRLRRADGEYRWILNTGTPRFAADGSFAGYIGSSVDITERKAAEIALEQSEARLRLALNAAQMGVWDWEIAIGKVTWSGGVDALFGFAPGEFAGTYEAFRNTIHPEDYSTVTAAIAHSVETDACYDIDFRIVWPNGTIRWIKGKGDVLRDTSGKAVRMMGTVLDITERKQSELALLVTQQRLEHLLTTSPAIIYSGKATDDFKATFVSDNITAVLGYAVSECLNDSQFWRDRIYPEDIPRVSLWMSKLFEQGHYTHEYRFLDKNGSYRWIQDEIKLLRDATGNPIEIVGSWLDITKRKLAEVTLMEANEELEIRVEERTSELKNAVALLSCLNSKLQAEIAQRQQTEAELCALFAAMTDVILVMDREGQYLKIAPTNPSLLYKPPKELIGKRLDQVFPQSQAEFFLEPIQRAIDLQETVKFEYSLCIGDTQVWFTAFVAPLQENTAIWMARDISARVLAEEELVLLRKAIESTSDAIGITDAKGKTTYLNPAFIELFEYTAEELTAAGGAAAIYTDLADAQAIFAAVQSGKSWSGEVKMKSRSGKVIQIALRVDAIKDSSGQLIGLMGIHTDISERKRAEEERQKLVALIENSSDFIGLASLEGTPLFLNAAGINLVGLTSMEEVKNKTITDFIMPEDLPEFDQHILPAVFQNGSWRGEFRFRHFQTGKPIPVDYNLFLIKHPETGEPIATATITRDISDRKRAEEALQQSDAQYRRLIETAAEGIWMLDVEGNTSFANAKMAQMLGYTIEEMMGMHLFAFMDAEGQAIAAENLARRRQGIAEQHDFKFLCKDGSELWAMVATNPILDAAGEYVGALGMVTDITDRKQAEEALQKTEARNRAILNAIPDLMFRQSKEGIYLDFRAAKEDELAVPTSGIIGKSVLEVLPRDLAQENIYYIEQTLSIGSIQIFEYKLPMYDQVHDYEARLVPCGEDEVLAIVRDITKRKQAEDALRESEARFRQLAQREELLNRLASQIRASLDLNTILETAVQQIRNLLQIERCLFIWYRTNALTPYWEIVQEAKDPTLQGFIGYTATNAEIGPIAQKAFKKEIIRIDDVEAMPDSLGREFYLSFGYTTIFTVPIHTYSGEIGVLACANSTCSRPWRDNEVELLIAVADQLAIAIDQADLYKQSRIAATTAQDQAQQLEQALHELQQTQAQLVQTEKMSSLGQLVAGIAHEINNPVNFIYGNLSHASEYSQNLLNLVELYQQHYPQPIPEIEKEIAAIDLDFLNEDLPKLLASMKLGADRIRQIVLSLRNFSRLDEAEMKPVDIHEGIDNTLLLLQNRLKAKPAHPTIEIVKQYGKLPLVECYAGQLNQVFMNLLTNAIDALEEQGKSCQNPQIQITTEIQDTKSLLIRIADNGPGITEQVRQRLFDPFFTTKPVGKGTGMGLSISYQIVVEKHGGQLQCISAPGKGAEFVILIPLQ